MDTCTSCGATLVTDLAWCPRCFTAVGQARPAIAAAPAPGQEADTRPLWVRTQMRSSAPPVQPVYSRWRAGPTSFGAFGRSVMTVLMILGLVAGYPMARGGMFAAAGVDIPGTPFLIGYAAVAIPLGLFLLTRIWKRARVA